MNLALLYAASAGRWPSDDGLCGRPETRRHIMRHRRSDPLAPTRRQLGWARRTFEANEPRDLFYRAAMDLVSRASKRHSALTLAESLAVLLQTWNVQYYRFRGGFTRTRYHQLERLLLKHRRALARMRDRSIATFGIRDEPAILQAFRDFEKALGPVGTSKCLHLLAPRFFPLWDQSIAIKYGFPLVDARARKYTRFMWIAKKHIRAFGGKRAVRRNPVKAWDEFNYCRYTLGLRPR